MGSLEGTLRFSENEGKFYIVKIEEEKILCSVEFSDSFQVQVDGNWVDTNLEIGSDDNGDLIFKLKNTNYKGNLDGVPARK